LDIEGVDPELVQDTSHALWNKVSDIRVISLDIDDGRLIEVIIFPSAFDSMKQERTHSDHAI
jgi:ribosomal protein L25 (general stress protein Ctc)